VQHEKFFSLERVFYEAFCLQSSGVQFVWYEPFFANNIAKLRLGVRLNDTNHIEGIHLA
jgi:hypothetical protein